MTNERLQKIQDTYRASLPEKADDLEECWRTVESGFFGPDAVSDLRDRVHKLGGSAGMYGYSDLAGCAKTLEKQLSGGVEDSADWRKSVREQVSDLITQLRGESQ